VHRFCGALIWRTESLYRSRRRAARTPSCFLHKRSPFCHNNDWLWSKVRNFSPTCRNFVSALSLCLPVHFSSYPWSWRVVCACQLLTWDPGTSSVLHLHCQVWRGSRLRYNSSHPASTSPLCPIPAMTMSISNTPPLLNWYSCQCYVSLTNFLLKKLSCFLRQ